MKRKVQNIKKFMIFFIIYVNLFLYNVFLDKTESFKYTILNYEENYEKILKRSKNNILILEKKQNIRIKFINEIIKTKNKYEKETNFTTYSLFNTILLTIILKQFLKENSALKKNNDLQQNLLKYSIEILNHQYTDISNLKLIIYYLGHLFIVLFNGMEYITNYFQVENTYIKKIDLIMENQIDKVIIEKNEIYPFLKINLISLGYLFNPRNIAFTLTKETQLTLLFYYVNILKELYPVIIENYDTIKQYLSNEINQFNITHPETGVSIADSNNNDNDIIINSNQNNLYFDFQQIIESLYNFFTYIITDISLGNFLFETMDKQIKKFINDNENNIKFDEILFLHIYEICLQQNLSKFFIISLIIYITNKILENIKNYYVFYDIIIKFYKLIMDDDILNERCTKLFAKIFIKEIYNIEYDNSLVTFLTFVLPKTNYSKKIIIPLITNISFLFKEQNLKNKLEIYKRCSLLLENYSLKELFQNEGKKESIEFESIKIMLMNFNIYDNSITELNTNNQLLIINYFQFYINLIIFIESNFENSEMQNNQSFKTKLFSDIISYIHRLELYSFDSSEYLTLILHYIKVLLFCFKYLLNTQDTYLIYRLMSQKCKLLLNEQCNGRNLSFLPYLSYYIIIFILIRITQIFKFPNSFKSIHNGIIEGINNIDKAYNIKFKEIKVEDLFKKEISDNKNNNNNINVENSLKILYQDLKTNFNYFFKCELNQSKFSRIMDLIYTQVFGCSSSLHSFFDSQLKNLGVNDRILEPNIKSNHNSNRTDVITEGNEINYDNYIKEDSISMKFSDESIMKENTFENISNEQLIKIPLKNSLKIINDQTLNDVIHQEEDNIKI